MTATAVRPQIVITLPSFRRNKPLHRDDTFVARVRKRFSLTARTIGAIVANTMASLWRHQVVRYSTYFLGGVLAAMVANVTITVGAVLLAMPFLYAGWDLLAELVFLCTYLVAWWSLSYYATGWILQWAER